MNAVTKDFPTPPLPLTTPITCFMDADITGPSIPKMYGIHGKAVGDGKEILPAVAEDGTRIMSVNLLVDEKVIY